MPEGLSFLGLFPCPHEGMCAPLIAEISFLRVNVYISKAFFKKSSSIRLRHLMHRFLCFDCLMCLTKDSAGGGGSVSEDSVVGGLA